jgi:hypothetical protein
LVAVGLLCACLGGLGSAFAWQQVSDSRPVAVAQRDIMRGDEIGAGDFGITDIGAGAGISTIPADQIDGLVGKHALFDIPNGALVAAEAVGDPVLPNGTAQVGLRLSAGRVPAGDLPVGSRVRLVEIPDANAEDPSRQMFDCVVVRSPRSVADGTVTLDVAVAESQAPALAILAATDTVALVKLRDVAKDGE